MTNAFFALVRAGHLEHRIWSKSSRLIIFLLLFVQLLLSSCNDDNALSEQVRDIETHNIENIGVQAYQQVIYNNNDYSYSCIDVLQTALASPYNQIPNGKVIQTDTDALANSRILEYADNDGFVHGTRINLDLSSKEYILYNFEGSKTYYYRVYRDNDPNLF